MNDLVRNIELADPRDAWRHTGDAPRVDNLDAYVEMRPEHATTPTVEIPAHLPLTVAEWRARTMAEPDFLLGNWLTTTSRVLITAATGLGKTNFALALGQAVSLGGGFLHWSSRRPSNVLYIDGEMSARLLRVRLIDEAARQGDDPEFFFALSHEDIPNFQPLNSPAGQDAIERIIAEIGSVDLIIFDNIMCLVAGDQKDTLPWQQTLPWALSLTRRCIGQIWVHHTGHDETRGYGDKAREWQMDTVIHLGSAKREDTDVSFNLEFRKARERTPSTRFAASQSRNSRRSSGKLLQPSIRGGTSFNSWLPATITLKRDVDASNAFFSQRNWAAPNMALPGRFCAPSASRL